MQERFDSTRRVPPQSQPGSPGVTPDTVSALKDLAALHDSGALDDAEFAAAKAKVLGGHPASS